MAVVTCDLQTYDDGISPNLYFVVGDQPYPLGTGSAGAPSDGVSVLEDVPLGFGVSEVGLTQELPLANGARVGSPASETYRSPAGSDITRDDDRIESLNVDRDNLIVRTVDQLTLNSVVLTSFSPFNPAVQRASFNRALLVVDASEQTAASQDILGWSEVVPSGRMRLKLPGGEIIEANPSRRANGVSLEDLLDADYYFDLPVSFRKTAFGVTPGTNGAHEHMPDNNANSTDTVLGTPSFAATFRLPKVRPTRPSTTTPTTARGAGEVPATAVLRRRPAALPTKAPGVPTGVPANRTRFPIPLRYLALAGLILVSFLARRLFVRHRHGSDPVIVSTTSCLLERPPELPMVPRSFVGSWDDVSTLLQGEPMEAERCAAEAPAAPPQADAEATVGAESTDDPTFRPHAGVNLLGPIEVTGLAFDPTRKVALELLCFLACHRGKRITTEAIRAELWPPDSSGKRASAETFCSYVSALRAVIGKGQFPRASAGVYALGDGVDTDWDRFRTLVSFAQVFGDDARVLLSSALGLIRGPLFSGVPTGRYAWAFEVGGLVHQMEVAVIAAASQLAELSFAAGDPEPALAGLGKALVATKDFGVADDLLTAAGATGNLSVLEEAWREVTDALGEDAESYRRSYEAQRRSLNLA